MRIGVILCDSLAAIEIYEVFAPRRVILWLAHQKTLSSPAPRSPASDDEPLFWIVRVHAAAPVVVLL
jgi:hypothetical protein